MEQSLFEWASALPPPASLLHGGDHEGASIPQAGIFLVELLLDNQWVADATLELI
jgi:hypothetical protein